MRRREPVAADERIVVRMFGALFGMWTAMFGVAVAAFALAYPVFWIWMVLDALLREQWEFPGGGANDKLLWVLLMVFAHLTSIAYFFVVFRKVRRGAAAQQAQGTAGAAPAAV